jgi:NAD(P)-dependent dehydrogenase (short-subunit alcohol dehydrogenase family)
MSGRLEGKVILVTGAASGIGKAIAELSLKEGAKVVLSDISESGEKTASDLSRHGELKFIRADVSSNSDVENLVNKTVQEFGRIDAACNNAGIEGVLTSTVEYPEDMWEKVMDINLKGVWLCMKYEIQQMLKQNGGSIVNTASVAGLLGLANASAYTASKHGVIGLTKAAAIEYATRNIRINAICPGWIETPMVMERGVSAKNKEAREQISAMTPSNRLGKPVEIAEGVVWLFSDAASFATGHPLVIDGGMVAQ